MRSRSNPPFNYVLILLIIALLVFAPPIFRWAIDQGYIKVGPRNDSPFHPHARVWVDRLTGYYYCQDSRLHGRTGGGFYLNQGDAVQKGYRAAAKEPCK